MGAIINWDSGDKRKQKLREEDAQSLDMVNPASLKDSQIDISLDYGTEESGIQGSRQAAYLQWESSMPVGHGSEFSLQQL